ncbi:hypothetical protein HAX54_030377 [Datura stramonium]|uniref:Uncharacterized protein n=1 Tax=Datura stramonium TaxID=4076 RepID=A0ABS8SAW3_DATST|nr:hypothetical protein [Datura stramonium]
MLVKFFSLRRNMAPEPPSATIDVRWATEDWFRAMEEGPEPYGVRLSPQYSGPLRKEGTLTYWHKLMIRHVYGIEVAVGALLWSHHAAHLDSLIRCHSYETFSNVSSLNSESGDK